MNPESDRGRRWTLRRGDEEHAQAVPGESGWTDIRAGFGPPPASALGGDRANSVPHRFDQVVVCHEIVTT